MSILVFRGALKADFNRVRTQSEQENLKMFAADILDSLRNLDKIPKKVKDFDKEGFKAEMLDFFRQKELL